VARARIARPATPSPPAEARSGVLRRGEFLAQLARSLRAAGPWRVLLAVRLDQVRELGDGLGQAAAFELEQAVAARLASELAPGDAQTLWMAFGFGVLVERASREAIEDLARRLCRVVAAAPFELRGATHALTVSVGVALPPAGDDAGAADRWFASAHAAQAIAHRLGGDRFDGVLSRDHGGMPPERVLIIREWVKEAASGENVQVEFQPAVPLRPGRPGLYCAQARLRDYRAPLAGVPRHEYLALAREAGALRMIDRMSLFAAFEAIEAERAQGRPTRVLAAVDLASVDAAQLRWLDAELRRRRAYADGLVVELDAEVALGRPELARVLQALEEAGVVVAIADAAGDMKRIAQLQRYPASLLRLPMAAVDSVPPARFLELLAPWRASGRELLVDQVVDVARMRGLWDLAVDYAQGEALAASSPRLDYEFSAGAP
jgi:predicted signal transduction protein with EAL and GGDEF domain